MPPRASSYRWPSCSGTPELAEFLATELIAQAPENDAVGPELYALWSRSFLGFQVDLAEAYEWGPSATR
ncbi:MAG TPA: hypothetical protein VH912_14715 [Streptosporangiaceae bacterium]